MSSPVPHTTTVITLAITQTQHSMQLWNPRMLSTNAKPLSQSLTRFWPSKTQLPKPTTFQWQPTRPVLQSLSNKLSTVDHRTQVLLQTSSLPIKLLACMTSTKTCSTPTKGTISLKLHQWCSFLQLASLRSTDPGDFWTIWIRLQRIRHILSSRRLLTSTLSSVYQIRPTVKSAHCPFHWLQTSTETVTDASRISAGSVTQLTRQFVRNAQQETVQSTEFARLAHKIAETVTLQQTNVLHARKDSSSMPLPRSACHALLDASNVQ